MLTLAATNSGGAMLMSLLPMIIIFGLMMWFMNRQNKKQQQKREDFLNSIHVGDKITTIGGLHGVISELNAEQKIATIDCDGIYLDFDLSAIKAVVGKTTPEQ